jgi:P-loop containing dynein motor region D4
LNSSSDQSEEEQPWFENFPVANIEDFWFSTVNEEVEGYYQEVRAVESV